MVPVLNAEKRGGLGKQKFLESFRLSTHERRIKEYGAPGRFGGYPSFGSHLSQTPIHTIQLLKVALRPCTSPPDMCGWTWNICLISITYHIPNLPLSLCHPPNDNNARLCAIPPRAALSLNKHAFTQGQIITFM